MGRITTFTPEAAAEICAGLSKGIPLARICDDEWLPAVRTVSDWKKANEDFAADFARARDEGFDAIAQRARETARGDTERGESSGDVQRDKLIIETDLKLLAKWDPKRYGDKVSIEASGPDGGPIQIDDATAAAKLAAIMAGVKARLEG